MPLSNPPLSEKLLKLELLDDYEPVANAWEELWHRCPTASVFQHPAWLISWWRHFGSGELLLVTIWNGEELAALLPLHAMNRERGQTAFLLGTGLSDCMDGLCAPESLPQVGSVLANWLDHNREIQFDFHDLQPGSFLVDLDAPCGWESRVEVQEYSPALPLEGFSEMELPIPAVRARELAYYRRRAQKQGRVEIQEATDDRCTHAMQDLIRLHSQQWRQRSQPGVLADRAVQAFHAEAVPLLARGGLLKMYTLSINGRIAGVWYGFRAHQRESFYLSGFDPEMKSISPGTLLIGHAIEQAFQSGCASFEFLRGQEPYKYRWGAQDRPLYRRVLFWKHETSS